MQKLDKYICVILLLMSYVLIGVYIRQSIMALEKSQSSFYTNYATINNFQQILSELDSILVEKKKSVINENMNEMHMMSNKSNKSDNESTNPLKLDLPNHLIKRKQRIKDYCNQHMGDDALRQVNSDIKWKEELWFDYNYKFLYCQISKASSSTWVDILLKLKHVNQVRITTKFHKMNIPTQNWRPIMRQRMYRLKNGSSIEAANSELLSFVFVRDPISRIISSYYDKMYRDWNKPQFDLTWMRNEIIANYRNVDPKSTGDAPTPSEFVRYILDSAKKYGPHNLDNHIKPLWASCPFCAIDFDIIGRIESRVKEATLISKRLNFPGKINVNEVKHKTASTIKLPKNKTEAFFGNLNENLKAKLKSYCQRDYDMFYFEDESY